MNIEEGGGGLFGIQVRSRPELAERSVSHGWGKLRSRYIVRFKFSTTIVMEKLLSVKRVEDTIRNSVNLDCLVPQLMKHGLLTFVEFTELSDRNVDEVHRINYLVSILKWKGGLKDQVKRFLDSLKGAREHTGHEDILQIAKEEVATWSDTETVNGARNGINGLSSETERKRQWPMQDDCESDSSAKKLKSQHVLPNKAPNFVGRQGLLEQSIQSLQQDSTQILSVVGQPAVGKSQFAIAVGQHMQQQLQYNVIYHDLLNTAELEFFDVNVNGCEQHCLILDNIDTLLFHTQLTSMLSSLRHIITHRRIKVITTSCKVFRHPEHEFKIETIRILPFTDAESNTYLLSMLEGYSEHKQGYSEQDVKPVVKVCAGVPLALWCAAENIKSNHWDVQDFCDDEEVMQLLEVESYSNSLSLRLKNRFSLLVSNHQDNLKKIANDPEKLHDLSLADKRSLYNSGWLEKGEGGNVTFLNGLLANFLRGISGIPDHVINHETGRAILTP